MQVGWGWMMTGQRGGACFLFRFQRCLPRQALAPDLVLIGREATRGRVFADLIDDVRRALDKAGVP